jgi:hypothetical protein
MVAEGFSPAAPCWRTTLAAGLKPSAHTTKATFVAYYPMLAPKERDLMFIGGGQGFMGRTAQEVVVQIWGNRTRTNRTNADKWTIVRVRPRLSASSFREL